MRRRRLDEEQVGAAAGVTVGVAACAACCAAPLSAALVSIGFGSAVASWLLPGLWALAGLLGLVYVGLVALRRARLRQGSEPARPVDLPPLVADRPAPTA